MEKGLFKQPTGKFNKKSVRLALAGRFFRVGMILSCQTIIPSYVPKWMHCKIEMGLKIISVSPNADTRAAYYKSDDVLPSAHNSAQSRFSYTTI